MAGWKVREEDWKGKEEEKNYKVGRELVVGREERDKNRKSKRNIKNEDS